MLILSLVKAFQTLCDIFFKPENCVLSGATEWLCYSNSILLQTAQHTNSMSVCYAFKEEPKELLN